MGRITYLIHIFPIHAPPDEVLCVGCNVSGGRLRLEFDLRSTKEIQAEGYTTDGHVMSATNVSLYLTIYWMLPVDELSVISNSTPVYLTYILFKHCYMSMFVTHNALNM